MPFSHQGISTTFMCAIRYFRLEICLKLLWVGIDTSAGSPICTPFLNLLRQSIVIHSLNMTKTPKHPFLIMVAISYIIQQPSRITLFPLYPSKYSNINYLFYFTAIIGTLTTDVWCYRDWFELILFLENKIYILCYIPCEQSRQQIKNFRIKTGRHTINKMNKIRYKTVISYASLFTNVVVNLLPP